jgi:hypothetical protein
MFDWVVVSLLGLSFIGLAIAWIAGFWFDSLEGMTLAILWAGIAFGAMFIFAGVWSAIYGHGIGARIAWAVFLIGIGLFKIGYVFGRLYGD